MSTSSPTIMPHRPSIPLWPLALLAGALPALAALVAWGLSIRFALAPECNPFIDGCVSISRAARHGLPNHVFRAIALPAAGWAFTVTKNVYPRPKRCLPNEPMPTASNNPR